MIDQDAMLSDVAPGISLHALTQASENGDPVTDPATILDVLSKLNSSEVSQT